MVAARMATTRAAAACARMRAFEPGPQPERDRRVNFARAAERRQGCGGRDAVPGIKDFSDCEADQGVGAPDLRVGGMLA